MCLFHHNFPSPQKYCSTKPSSRFSPINPAILAGDLADKNGGAYANSNSVKSYIVL